MRLALLGETSHTAHHESRPKTTQPTGGQIPHLVVHPIRPLEGSQERPVRDPVASLGKLRLLGRQLRRNPGDLAQRDLPLKRLLQFGAPE